MALITGIRRPETCGKIRPRHADTVIAPRINHHVVFGRHVALDTLRPGRALGVVMMLRDVVYLRRVATSAEFVTLGTCAPTVGIMAIATHDPGLMHATLQKRTINIDLVVDLSIGVIEPRCQKRRTIVIEKRLAGIGAFTELCAP